MLDIFKTSHPSDTLSSTSMPFTIIFELNLEVKDFASLSISKICPIVLYKCSPIVMSTPSAHTGFWITKNIGVSGNLSFEVSVLTLSYWK